MEKERTSLVFYRDWWKAIRKLPKGRRLEVLTAVFDYAFEGEIPDDEMLDFATSQMRMFIDRDWGKYLRSVEQRKNAIAKRWEKYKALEEREKADTNVYDRIQPNTTVTGNRNINENNNDNENDNDNNNENVNDNGVAKATINKEILKRERERETHACACAVNKKGDEEGGGGFRPPTVGEVAAFAAENSLEIDAEGFVNFHDGNGWKLGKNEIVDWRAAARTWAKRGAAMKRQKTLRLKKDETDKRTISERRDTAPEPESRQTFSDTL